MRKGADDLPHYSVEFVHMMLRQRKIKNITPESETRRLEGVSSDTAEEGRTPASTFGDNDDGVPKPDPSGSSSSDDNKLERGGFRLRKDLIFATWNVRGFTTGKLNVTAAEMRRCSVHILGISEHWW